MPRNRFSRPSRSCPQASIAVAVLFVIFSSPLPALAQQPGPPAPSPRLLVVMPCGGKAGSTFEVTVSGQDLEGPQDLLFSHEGIKAEMMPAPPPPPPDPKKPGVKVAQPAAIKFKVTIAADTPLGSHDVRVMNKLGVSNPRAFVVGDLKEVLEKEPNNDVGEAQRIDINTTVNGAITTPTDVDYFVFAGKKGQRVVVSCLTTSIDSRLQADLQMYRGKDKIAANRNYRAGDALLDATLPEDGDYHVRLCSFTYTQGSAEHFYRLTISTAPWIDAIYPPVVELGKQARLTLHGRNIPRSKPDASAILGGSVLEKTTLTVDVPRDVPAAGRLDYHGHIAPKASSLDGFEYRVRNTSGTSSPYLLTYSRGPVILENEANDTSETAQEVSLPCEIVGRIKKKGDRGWYAFKAKKGEVYSIEAFGDRLGSPIALYFILRNADDKKVIGEFDDNPDVLHPQQFFTRSEDPARYRFLVPADGRYQLQISSREAETQASPRDIYCLRIAPEHPDFRLVLMPQAVSTPDACVLGQGGRQYYTVFVWRLDGFNGEITLTADGLPEGVACPPQVIGPGVRQATLVLGATTDAPIWTGAIKVKGTATINGQKEVREARSATITWPAGQNSPALSRLDRSLVLAVRDKPAFVLTAGIDKATAAPGDKVTVPLTIARNTPEANTPLQVTVLNLPGPSRGRQAPPAVTINPSAKEGSVVIDVRPDMPAGTYTVLLRGQMQVAGTKGSGKQKQNYTVAMPSTPITLIVESKKPTAPGTTAPGTVAFTVTPANLTVKAGAQAEVLVKIKRSDAFKGPIQVKLRVPPEEKGISAEAVTIAEGKNEARIIVKAGADAAPGKRSDLTVRARPLSGSEGARLEAKLSITVGK